MPTSLDRPRLRRLPLVGLAVLLLVAAACGSDSKTNTAGGQSGAASSGGPQTTAGAPITVHLGYFPNITHAPAIVGVQKNFFQQQLGANTLQTQTFNAGGDATTALLSGAVDITFIGPSPSVNAFQKSNGDVRIVAGATSGGAGLVVKPTINSVADLKGKTLATPQLGNTQDVALRKYLKDNGLNTDTSGGGDVHITPLANADTLTAFANGSIDGAWVPEPFMTRMIQESGGKLLVDEKTLWPDGKFVTTNLLTTKDFLDKHPDVVEDIVKGEQQSIDYIESNKTDAESVVNDGINQLTGKPLKDSVLSAAFDNMSFSLDPLASALKTSADNAIAVGLLDPVDNLKGIFDLTIVNQVLKDAGQPEVQGLS